MRSPKVTHVHEIDGMQYFTVSDIVAVRATPLNPEDKSPLARAIRAQWPDSDATYWGMIARRYRVAYSGIPEAAAVKAVRAGHSVPREAMNARLIRRRPYVGFGGSL